MNTARRILTTVPLSALLGAATAAPVLTAAPIVPSAQGDSGHCGDGIAEGDEECDDGNRIGGDGCSALCVRTNADRHIVLLETQSGGLP